MGLIPATMQSLRGGSEMGSDLNKQGLEMVAGDSSSVSCDAICAAKVTIYRAIIRLARGGLIC